MSKKSDLNPSECVERLRVFVRVFTDMNEPRERRAALYYLVARHYGNEYGDRLLAMLPRDKDEAGEP